MSENDASPRALLIVPMVRTSLRNQLALRSDQFHEPFEMGGQVHMDSSYNHATWTPACFFRPHSNITAAQGSNYSERGSLSRRGTSARRH